MGVALVPNVVSIFITAENEEELVRRLCDRKTEAADQLKMRVVTARKELERANEFDYIVVNREGRLQETVDKVMAIITAEKCRTDWKPVEL